MEHRKLHIFYHSNSSILEKIEDIETPMSVGDSLNIDKDFYIINQVHRHFSQESMTDMYLYKVVPVEDDTQTEWLYQLTI